MSNLSSATRIVISLLRLPTYLLLVAYIVLAFIAHQAFTDNFSYTFNELFLLWQFIVTTIILAAWYINAAAINDYADFSIDKVNLPDDKHRPLVTGLATKKDLLLIAIITALVAMTATLWLYGMSSQISWMLGIFLLLNLAYSLKPLQISRRGGIAILILPLGYTFLPISLGIMLTGTLQFNAEMIWLCLGMYGHFTSRIILKDHRDVKGDKLHGKKTFLIRHGHRCICLLAGLTLAISTTIFLIAFNVYLQVFSYALVFLTAFAGGILFNLAKNTDWPQQKIYLSVFGRTMSGITAVLMLAFISYVWQFILPWQIALTAALGLIYAVSAHNEGLYNLTRLTGNKG